MHLLLWSGFNASRGTEIPQALQWGKENNRRNKTEKWTKQKFSCLRFSSVQCFIRVQLFATAWTAARQASLSFTISWSLLKLMSIKLVMHPTNSSSVAPFPSTLQSFPESGYFPVSWLFALGSQSIRASASVLPMNSQGWFPLGWTALISLLSKGLSRVY